MSPDDFEDARSIPSGTIIEADIVVIGSGAAGITIARDLAGHGLRIVMLEAGGLSVDPDVSALSQIDDVGRPYPDPHTRRLRYFGGTTNHWGGQCAPLDPLDLKRQDWIEHSGWPYGYDVLRPYYERAHEVLGLGAFDYRPETAAAELGFDLFPFDPARIETVMARYNRVRFGLEHGAALTDDPTTRILLYADVSSIDLETPESDTVRGVTVRTVAGNSFAVAGRRIVLAAGGIENPRLLLLSNAERPAGLGNQSDAVGRYYQEHLLFPSGVILPEGGYAALDFYGKEWSWRGIHVRSHIALPAEEVRRLRIPRFRSQFWLLDPYMDAAQAALHGDIRPDDLLTMIADPRGMGHLAKCRWDAGPRVYALANYVQQVPNPESRIMLSDRRDDLGRPQPQLQWKLSSQDHEGVLIAHRAIANEVGRSGFGRMRLEIEPNPETLLEGCWGGAHHMGTTRMDDDPARGVADGNARVHGTNNLFIAGSSLFPTCGWQNPTLTIVATSLKLADHLRDGFIREGAI
jgi:choline dehydrogenase-like flavoprotein